MWQESRRIFGSRKTVFVITIIVILNLFFFLDDQRKAYPGMTMGEIVQMSRQLEGMISEYAGKEEPRESLEQEFLSYTGESQAEFENLNYLLQQAKALQEYQAAKEKREQNLKNYKALSIFRKEKSTVLDQGQKTMKDYARVENVVPEFGNYRLAESIGDAGMTNYFYLMLLVYVCMSFLEERKSGFQGIVHLSSGGRGKLEAKRIGILFVSAIASAVLLYGSEFFVGAACYGGLSDLANPVQSLQEFQNVTYPLSVGSCLLLLLGLHIIGGFTLALLIHLILLVSENSMAAFGIMGIVGVLEVFLWNNIAPQSRYRIWKYCNVVNLLKVREPWSIYANFTIAGKIINLHTMIAIITIFIIVFAIAASVFLTEHLYPYGRRQFFVRIAKKMQKLCSALTRSYTYLGFELHKLLFQQKGGLVLLLFAVLAWRGLQTNTLVFDSMTEYENYYYEKYAGEVNRYTIKAIRAEAAEIEAQEKEQKELEQAWKNGSLTMAEYQMKLGEGTFLSYKKEALEHVWEDVVSLMGDAEEKEKTLYLVNPLGWEQLLGEDGTETNEQLILQELFFILLLFSGVYSYEYQTGAVTLLRGSRKGRGRNYLEKILLAEGISFLMIVIDFGVRYKAVGQQYGLAESGAPVQSLSWLRDFSISCSIRGYIVLVLLGKWLIFSGIIGMLFLLSVYLKNSRKVLMAALAVLELPALLGWKEVPFFKNCSILRIADFNQVLVKNSSNNWLALLILVFILGVGAAAHLFAEEHWENAL